MDSDNYTCGTCKHGALYDTCSKCEDEYERLRSIEAAAANLVEKQGTRYEEIAYWHLEYVLKGEPK